MAIQFNPYFTFAGNAREAIEFYAEVFGGELQLATFKDFQAPVAPAQENLVMHAELITEHGFNLRVSDGAALSEAPAQATTNMEASLIGPTEDVNTARPWFDKLSEGATNIQPLTAAPLGRHLRLPDRQVWHRLDVQLRRIEHQFHAQNSPRPLPVWE
ncbi:MAG: VOC family protein [Rothia sp. (in: high G+C Gram-positive bacteria)]|uniref:VOC family protein n=1 Tax=Rothia sp. (in: high G+C Gram-positive bacteria) TaxID=1885016 RepID=UPI0027053229|nr:VOC family protein [Rothia sp. (in: high G+C Gram-positive bacteria)]